MSSEKFFDLAISLLQDLRETQLLKIKEAAGVVAGCLRQGGVLHLFGTGQSHMIAEEAYSRAGGIFTVNPMLEPGLMLHEGYGKSSALERLPGLAGVIFDQQPCGVESKDVAIIISNSGRNAAPVEMAMHFRAKGVPVVAITSLAHSRSVESRHESGKKLHEVTDIVIDNRGVPGDAILELPGTPAKTCPTSTLTGVTILWNILAQALFILVGEGRTVPVMMSGNLDGADKWNSEMMALVSEKYGGRVQFR